MFIKREIIARVHFEFLDLDSIYKDLSIVHKNTLIHTYIMQIETINFLDS